jgi:large subunit ribosomal protein L21
MYAVIRAGGKQYRVAPGDVIRIEKSPAANGHTGADRTIEFSDVLAVSGKEGQIGLPGSQALVTGTVMEEGRGDKVLVFHYKRKKQYKKLRGHRQDFTAVRITEIAFDGQKFSAPELPAKAAKPLKAKPAHEDEGAEEAATTHKAAHGKAAKHHAAPAKHTKKKSGGKKKAAAKQSSHKKKRS